MEDHNSQNDRPFITETEIAVSETNQIRLTEEYVAELGFKSAKTDTVRGAKVAWYYHERDNKAVLGDEKVDRQSLEFCGARRLSGVSNDELDSGDIDGARVVVSNELPDALYNQLTEGSVVLKPINPNFVPGLERALVSVYPAEAYYRGELPNVERVSRIVEHDNAPNEVGSRHDHDNCA